MRKLALVLLGLLLGLAAFWVGLMLHFPGETVSRYVQGHVNRFSGVRLALAPAELRWFGLYVPEAELFLHHARAEHHLITFSSVTIPVSWRLLRGLPATGVIGDNGSLSAFVPWSQSGTARVQGRVLLQELRVPPVFKPIEVAGSLDFSGRFTRAAPRVLRERLPEGELSAHGEALRLSGVQVAGRTLPDTTLETLDMRLTTGSALEVASLTYNGDLRGRVEGRVMPDLRTPRASGLALRIETSLREEWLAQLGELRPLLESFLEQGRMTLELSGTVGNPRLNPVRP